MPGNNGSAHQLPRQRHAYHHRHQDPHHGHPHSHQHLQVGKGNGMNVSNYKLNCIELNRSLKAMQFVLENNMCKIVQRCLNFKSMIFHDASIWVEAQSVDPVWVKHWKMSETSELGKKKLAPVLPLVGSCATVVSSNSGTPLLFQHRFDTCQTSMAPFLI